MGVIDTLVQLAVGNIREPVREGINPVPDVIVADGIGPEGISPGPEGIGPEGIGAEDISPGPVLDGIRPGAWDGMSSGACCVDDIRDAGARDGINPPGG